MRRPHCDVKWECLRRRIFRTAPVTGQSGGKSRFVVAAVSRSGLLLTRNGIVYDAATVKTGLIAFIALGAAASALFGVEPPARR